MNDNNPDVEFICAAGGLVWRDSPRGREILVIHRAQYEDWTLPKGKLEKNEQWMEAAVREVEEETGYDVHIQDFAGVLTYMYEGRPKIVLFWNMSATGNRRQSPHEERTTGEVDDVQWMTAQEAVNKLSYPNQRALVADSLRE